MPTLERTAAEVESDGRIYSGPWDLVQFHPERTIPGFYHVPTGLPSREDLNAVRLTWNWDSRLQPWEAGLVAHLGTAGRYASTASTALAVPPDVARRVELLLPIFERIERLVGLPLDRYEKAATSDTIVRTLLIVTHLDDRSLRQIFITLTGDGELQMEWARPEGVLEVVVPESAPVTYLTSAGTAYVEGDLTGGEAEIALWIGARLREGWA